MILSCFDGSRADITIYYEHNMLVQYISIRLFVMTQNIRKKLNDL